MGADVDGVIVYGLCFDWRAIQHLEEHPDFKALAAKSRSDHILDLWEEMGQHSISPFYDAPLEDRAFLLGFKPKASGYQMRGNYYDVAAFNEFLATSEQNKGKLEQLCKDWGLPWSEPRVMVFGNVW